MSWKCNNCGQKLSGKEIICPECAEKTVYECKKCGKVMDNGKHKYCPVCNTKKAEKQKGALVAGAAVGSIVFGIITKDKFGGNKR